LVVLMLPASASAARGPGLVTFPVRGGSPVAFNDDYGLGGIYALAALPGGGVAASGLDQETRRLAVAELLPDGNLNPAFGTGGVDLPKPAAKFELTPEQVFTEPDGGLLIIGSSSSALAVVRLNANGSLATSFGEGGVATVPNMGGGVSGSLLPNGSIVVAGQIGSASDGRLAVARLTTAGRLDPTFGTAGMAIVSGKTPTLFDSHVAEVPDGSVLDAFGSVLVKLTAVGSPDPTFAGGGRVALPGSAEQILAQSDGSVLVLTAAAPLAGGGESGATVSRYTSSGSLDTSYGTAGMTSFAARVSGSADAEGEGSAVTLLPTPSGGADVVGLDAGAQSKAIVERLSQDGTAAAAGEDASVALPFGGGSFDDLGAMSVTADPFPHAAPPFAAVVRADGSLLMGTGLDVLDNDADDDIPFIEEWAVAAITPAMSLEATFGGASGLHVNVSLPALSRAKPCQIEFTKFAACVAVTLQPSADGIAAVQIYSNTTVIGQQDVILWTTGKFTEWIPLTNAGRRILEAAAAVPITVWVTATDMADNKAKARAMAKVI
jgi:uncharacterized delta-60 repeat protein